MRELWIVGHLLWLSAEDIRERQLSMVLIAELWAVGLVWAVRTDREVVWIPGILLLCVGYVSGEAIGYGDGWLVLALGAWLSLWKLLEVLGLSFLYCLIFSIVSGQKDRPFVPFLTAAYITGAWI